MLWQTILLALCLQLAAWAHRALRTYRNKRLFEDVSSRYGRLDTPAWRPPTRAESLSALASSTFDILVIGAGSVGAGCALDGASRGLRVALIECGDYASETSSKSTKLLHGGIRYLDKALRQFDLSQLLLVREALSERRTVLRVAPYLTSVIPIMIPVYSWLAMAYYWILCKAYDFLSSGDSLGPSFYMSARRSLLHFPGLARSGLKGSIVYHDGIFDDARLGITLVMTAIRHGATAANYVRAVRLTRGEGGRITSALCRDLLTGSEFSVSASCFISAAGPFTDEVRRMQEEAAPPRMVHSAGAHLVFPPGCGPVGMGLVDVPTADGRMAFVLPWRGRTLIGSTESIRPPGHNIAPTRGEIDFLVSELLSCTGSSRRPVPSSAWCAVRPLVLSEESGAHGASISGSGGRGSVLCSYGNPSGNRGSGSLHRAPGSESVLRSYEITASEDGLIVAAGGKWTTYRLIAEHVIDKAVKQFRLRASGGCVTRYLQILGSSGYSLSLYSALSDALSVDAEYAKHLASFYGSGALSIGPYLREYPERLSKECPFRAGEILYCIEREHAVHVTDVLNNRFRVSFLDVAEAAAMVDKVAGPMGRHFKWSAEQAESERAMAMESLKGFGLGVINTGGAGSGGEGRD